MGTIRFWLALLAAASVPLSFFLWERQQDQRHIKELRKAARKTTEEATDAARERLSAAGDAARERLNSFTDATRGAAGTVAGTASRVATGVVASAPLVGALAHRSNDSDDRQERESDDWKKYPQMISR